MVHYKHLLLTPLVAATLASSVLPAWTQVAAPPSRPLRIDLGLLLPTDGTVRSRTGSTHFAIGGTLDVQKLGQGVLGLYADGSLLNESHKAMNMASVGVSYRSYLSSGEGSYVGLGVGAYYLDYKDAFVDGNKTGIGGKVFAGYDFPIGAFVEANYTLAPSVEGRQPGQCSTAGRVSLLSQIGKELRHAVAGNT